MRLGGGTAALWFLLAMSCAGTPKKNAPIVTKIVVEGNHALSDGHIKSKIRTTKTGWWPFASKQYFDAITWRVDLERIVRLYQSNGFYQARIAADRVTPLPHDAVALDVEVDEGTPTSIDSVTVTGLESVPAADRPLPAELAIAVGDRFTEAIWTKAKTTLLHHLREEGYAQVRVEGQAHVGLSTHRAALEITVSPGALFRFGDILLDTGKGVIAPVWIWQQARLAIPEGERFSDEALEEAQRRVTRMGVFAAVKVTAGTPAPSTGRLPVLVETREAPLHTVRAGVGVRVDQIRNEARLISEWTNRNFLGGLRRLTAHGEAGWAFIPNTYAVLRNSVDQGPRNGPIARLKLEFQQPHFLDRPSLREQSSIEASRTLEQAYDALGGKVSNGIVWSPRASVTIYPSHNLEGYYLNGPPTASALAAPLTLGCHTTGDSCFIWLSYLEEIATWDRRDNALEPHNGFYASLSLQEGGGPLLGDFHYYRVLPDVRGYVSLGDNDQLTFAGRLRVGELFPTSGNSDDSAVVTRFYAGGAMSMRGFNDRRLSPMLLTQAPVSPGNPTPPIVTLPIGGNGLIDGSFEVRYALTEHLIGAVFLDFGQVTRGTIGLDDVGHMLFAVGAGLRYLTPVGPIRLDFGRRLQIGRPPPLFVVDASGAITEQTYAVDDSCFGLGGSGRVTVVTDNLCVLQISIGEAF